LVFPFLHLFYSLCAFKKDIIKENNFIEFLARNSQLMGRDRQFAERFTNVLVAFNAIECADSVPYVPRTTNPDAYSAADKMARLVEILFYVTKNRESFLVWYFCLEIPRTNFPVHKI
jgi:hypothetical protein